MPLLLLLINKSVESLFGCPKLLYVAQFVYKSHTISVQHATRGRQPQTPAAHPPILAVACLLSCGCPGQLPMKSLAKPNNTQSHFDFGQTDAPEPAETYGKTWKKKRQAEKWEMGNGKEGEKEKDTLASATYCGVLFAFCFYWPAQSAKIHTRSFCSLIPLSTGGGEGQGGELSFFARP